MRSLDRCSSVLLHLGLGSDGCVGTTGICARLPQFSLCESEREEVHDESVSTIAPPPCQRQFQARFRVFSPSFLSFFAGPTCSCACFYKCKSIPHLFFNLAACSGEYSSFFFVRVIGGLGGGGYRSNTHDRSS